MKYIDFMKTAKINSPRGPVEIDPVERDVVQNIYIRRVEKRDGQLVNVDIDMVPMVKDHGRLIIRRRPTKACAGSIHCARNSAFSARNCVNAHPLLLAK